MREVPSLRLLDATLIFDIHFHFLSLQERLIALGRSTSRHRVVSLVDKICHYGGSVRQAVLMKAGQS